MRIPLAGELDSRDGTSNRDERLTNVLSETDEGVTLAVVRPGLVTQAEGTGVGGGLVAYNNELVSVYGATLGVAPRIFELNWTNNPVGEYLVTDQIPIVIFASDNTYCYIGMSGDLYSTVDGQSITNLGAYDNNLFSRPYFDTVTSKWYAITSVYDVDLDDYTYYFAESSNALAWSVISDITSIIFQGHVFSVSGALLTVGETSGGAATRSTDGGLTWTTIAGAVSGLTGCNLASFRNGVGYVFGNTAFDSVVDQTTDGLSFSRTVLPIGSVVGFEFYNGRYYFLTAYPQVIVYSSSSVSSDADDYTVEVQYTYAGGEEGNGQSYGLNATSAGLIFWHINYPYLSDIGVLETESSSPGGFLPLATIATGLYDFAQSPI